MVIADNIAQTLSRKSATRAMGEYGVKNDWRRWSAAQRKTADCDG